MKIEHPEILIFGSLDNDPTAKIVATVLERDHGRQCLCLDTRGLGEQSFLSFAFPPISAVVTMNGAAFDLSAVRSVWYRRRYEPEIVTSIRPVYRGFARNSWNRLINGIHAATRHAFWVNDPKAHEWANNKALQLALAAEIGFFVPETLISCDPEAVTRFIARDEAVVSKALDIDRQINNPHTRLIGNRERKRIKNIGFCPAIFQRFVPAKGDVRAVVVGNRVFAGLVDTNSTADGLDWRLDPNAAWRRHSLPANIQRKCIDITRHLGLFYSAIDLRLTPEGRYAFFEVNPGGQYFFLEAWTKHPISEALASGLAQCYPAQGPAINFSGRARI